MESVISGPYTSIPKRGFIYFKQYKKLDIVFFIFLYQRWMYKTDLSRVNEFGYSGDMEEASKNKQVQDASGSTGSASNGKAIADKKKD